MWLNGKCFKTNSRLAYFSMCVHAKYLNNKVRKPQHVLDGNEFPIYGTLCRRSALTLHEEVSGYKCLLLEFLFLIMAEKDSLPRGTSNHKARRFLNYAFIVYYCRNREVMNWSSDGWKAASKCLLFANKSDFLITRIKYLSTGNHRH